MNIFEKLFEGKPPPGARLLHPKTLVPITGIALWCYNQLASKGVIGAVRLSRDEETGEFQSRVFFDGDDPLYDGPIEHMEMIKDDLAAARLGRKRYEAYTKHQKKETNGHG